jgi:SnoaL-like domain
VIGTATDVVAAYGAAWNEPDEATRRACLERSWAEDGVYCDPTARAEGREALVAHIGRFLAERRGHRIEVASGVDAYGSQLRFAWRMRGPDGEVLLEGLDFGELDDSGRLKRIVGFFGPLPTAA